MNRDIILKLENVSKRFLLHSSHKTLFRLGKSVLHQSPEKQRIMALRHINLEVARGDKIGIIGRNASGKTTLLRLMSGIYPPSSGKITRKEELIPLFSYQTGLHLQLPVIDNIFILGAFFYLTPEKIRGLVDQILSFSELQNSAYTPVIKLSSGQIQRLCFSVFMHNEFQFMAMDECFSMADMQFNEKCDTYFNSLMSSDKTIFVCSHSLEHVFWCSKVLWLEQGQIRAFGDPVSVIEQYKAFCSSLNKN